MSYISLVARRCPYVEQFHRSIYAKSLIRTGYAQVTNRGTLSKCNGSLEVLIAKEGAEERYLYAYAHTQLLECGGTSPI